MEWLQCDPQEKVIKINNGAYEHSLRIAGPRLMFPKDEQRDHWKAYFVSSSPQPWSALVEFLIRRLVDRWGTFTRTSAQSLWTIPCLTIVAWSSLWWHDQLECCDHVSDGDDDDWFALFWSTSEQQHVLLLSTAHLQRVNNINITKVKADEIPSLFSCLFL